jgi:hypothetical protein
MTVFTMILTNIPKFNVAIKKSISLETTRIPVEQNDRNNDSVQVMIAEITVDLLNLINRL